MKIGVIGSGAVGKTLAAGFLKHGHQVTIGTREAAKLKDWAAQHSGAKVAGFAETAAFGEVVVLAVAGAAALDALKLAGVANIDGKPVIDTSNPIGGGPPVHGVLSYFTSLTNSLMERLQKAFPSAQFVKAFNSVGNGQMVDPQFAGGKPTMFICGDDDGAKKTVAELIESSAGRSPTWARWRRRGRSNPCVCCGASPASTAATGRRTPSNCCAEPAGEISAACRPADRQAV